MSDVFFDEASHGYVDALNGNMLASVTQVICAERRRLGEWMRYSEESSDRGHLVHLYTAAVDLGAEVPPLPYTFAGYARAWARWTSLAKPTWDEDGVERIVFSAEDRIAGTIDRIGTAFGGERVIVDIKSGVRSKWHDVQIAAYDWLAGGGYRRLLVYVDRHGRFKVEHVKRGEADLKWAEVHQRYREAA